MATAMDARPLSFQLRNARAPRYGVMTLAAIAACVGACSDGPPPRSYDFFMEDSIARDGVLARCDQNPDASARDIECANARRAATAVLLKEERARREEYQRESEAKIEALRRQFAAEQRAREARLAASETADDGGLPPPDANAPLAVLAPADAAAPESATAALDVAGAGNVSTAFDAAGLAEPSAGGAYDADAAEPAPGVEPGPSSMPPGASVAPGASLAPAPSLPRPFRQDDVPTARLTD